MRIEIQPRIVGDDNSVISADEVLHFDKSDDRVEAIGLSAQLLKGVLRVGSAANAGTIRRPLHKVAARHEADLGSEQPVGLESDPDNGQPLPQETVIVGIDGGYLRNWYDKKRNFEVIVGKPLATGRNDRYFGLVSSQDDLSDRRLAAVLHSQDLPGSPAVTMLTDGGDSVRALVGVMAPGAVPILDWFHC